MEAVLSVPPVEVLVADVRPTRASTSRARALTAPVGSAVALALIAGALWELAKWITGSDDLTMPHTWSIVSHLGSETSQGEVYWRYLLRNTWSTAKASLVGLLFGVLLGFMTGVAIARSVIISRGLTPLVVAAQAVPVVAVAPAIVLWLGTGWATKAVIATFLTFFPITVAVTRGIKAVPVESRELFHTIGASRRTVLFGLELPSALPLIFVGLETAAAFSVVGAIVAELPFGSKEGLGVVILTSWQFYTIQPEALYGVALAACALGAVFVLSIRLTARLMLGPRAQGEVML